ncbi:hypothetical protein BDV29DRAFT_57648 [Aspergillus leporis]|uniref:Uncharacterized protein n=1 Tax=Aspergillus leporis TaxID=41062 RepID=A0A5N5WLK4_9EURO|nr:hypothetical protein BDV29DRAFT_57648 [Aspergillus leporis]
MAKQNSILLEQFHQLRMSNKCQKENTKLIRAFIQSGGSLTGDKCLRRLREKRGHTRRAIIGITPVCTVQ